MKSMPASAAAIEYAVKLLRDGGLVAFPTETVYGLGADASNPEAVKRIFSTKGRPADHPLIVHIANASQLGNWADPVPETARLLAAQFWPGPLTLILHKRPEVPFEVTGGQQTVALRVPDHPVALQLLQAFGGGLAAPSANRFGRISPTQAAHVIEEFGSSVDLILDGGPCAVGVESTIIDLSSSIPQLLRPGQISQRQIEAVLGVTVAVPVQPETRAPGTLEIHYAPITRSLRSPIEDLPQIIGKLLLQKKKLGILAIQFIPQMDAQIHLLRLPNQAERYAEGLYAAMRAMDNAGLDLILVEQPPETEAWTAVNDRLQRATEPANAETLLHGSC